MTYLVFCAATGFVIGAGTAEIGQARKWGAGFILAVILALDIVVAIGAGHWLL